MIKSCMLLRCLHTRRDLCADSSFLRIRSLSSDDLKRRQLSGRHQISSGGKHLIDGIPFGRPWLMTPRDRPPIELPPRKRARIGYGPGSGCEGVEQQDEDEDRQQLLLEGPVDDVDEDDEDDDEFAPNGGDQDDDGDFTNDDDDEIGEDMQLLRADNAVDGDDIAAELLDLRQDNLDQSIKDVMLRVDSESYLEDHTAVLQSAFPLTPLTTIQIELHRCRGDLIKTYNALSLSNDPAFSLGDVVRNLARMAKAGQSRSADVEAAEERDSSEFRGFDTPAKPLIVELDSSDEANRNGGSQSATLEVCHSAASVDSDEDSSDTSSSGTSDSEDDETSSDGDSDDGTSSSGDDSDSDAPQIAGRDRAAYESTDGTSDTGSDEASEDDSSDSDDEFESASEPTEEPSKSMEPEAPPLPARATNALIEKKEPSASKSHNQVTPGQGLTKTQKRNARRKKVANLKLLETKQSESHKDGMESQEQTLLLRKQALMNSIDDGTGADGSQSMQLDTPAQSSQIVVQESGSEMQDESAQKASGGESQTAETPQGQEPSPKDDSAKRRLRIDMGAGRRLLFGALGIKTPKTKADEEKIKANLMEGVRPLKNPRIAEEPAERHEITGSDTQDLDPDRWREKINYRAVECCYDGIVLSEPPFPFVQRWDPQQKVGSMKKRKRKEIDYNGYHEDQDDSWYDHTAEPEQGSGKKKRRTKYQNNPVEDDVVLNYDEAPQKNLQQADSQLVDMDDLPSLPADIESLPALKAEEAKSGMVVTWKQWQLSEGTAWQPRLAPVTGLILPGSDATTIYLLLAKRDREKKEKVYDEETGKRIYGKFEAPVSDDEDDGEDDGYRDVPWADMVEPRLVQREPPSSLLDSPLKIRAATGLSGGVADSIELTKDERQEQDMDMQQVKAPDTDSFVQTGQSQQHESGESTSIQSGQAVPLTGLLISEDEGLVSVSNDSGEADKVQTPDDDGLNSPSRQLHEMSQAVSQQDHDVSLPQASAELYEAEPAVGDELPELESELVIFETGAPDAGFAENEADLPELVQRDGSAEASANEDAESVVYPQLKMPSPSGSVRSGRQPEFGETMDGGWQEESNNSVIPETLLGLNEVVATPDSGRPLMDPSRSSSPFPSLEEVFQTAATSRHLQSPKKSSQESVSRSQQPKSTQGREYDEAMRRLDEGEESDSQGRGKSMRSLFPNASQPAPAMDLLEVTSSPVGKRGHAIVLSSSPISVQYVEDYAEDSIDETYEDPGPLPKGSGWVEKKTTAKKTRVRNRVRGASVPSTMTGRIAGQGNKSTQPRSSSSKGRRSMRL